MIKASVAKAKADAAIKAITAPQRIVMIEKIEQAIENAMYAGETTVKIEFSNVHPVNKDVALNSQTPVWREYSSCDVTAFDLVIKELKEYGYEAYKGWSSYDYLNYHYPNGLGVANQNGFVYTGGNNTYSIPKENAYAVIFIHWNSAK